MIDNIKNKILKTSEFPFFYELPYLIAIIFSVGFLHPDEHFQIIEPLRFLESSATLAELTWEFSLKMRPWFQTYIYFIISKLFFFLGPFKLVSLFKLLTASIVIIYLRQVTSEVESHNKKYYYLLWFLPLLGARTASDVLFSVISAIALFQLIKSNHSELKRFILSGTLFGLAFLIKYQAIIILGLYGIWLILIKRLTLKNFFAISLSFIFVSSLEIFFNFLATGELFFSTYNHLYQNIVLGKSAGFGVTPWWDYLKMILIKGVFPLSIIFSYMFFKDLKSFKSSPVGFIALSYLIIHMLIPHKEFRFLMPIFFMIPMVLDYKIELLKNKFVWCLNIVILFIICLKPQTSNMSLYSYIYENKVNRVVTLDKGAATYSLPMKYFLPEKFELIKNESLDGGGFVLLPKLEDIEKLPHENCDLLVSKYPRFVWKYKSFNKRTWTLWKCDS